ncbi:uncharacterized protein LY89DRAFT_589396 [Mollisia scopiformis]|uniref:ABM domain-containing protein n=1 Tax=Mollisia scopiformis TaxID=149040 RepID=A0A194X479_MOLSC|nr:uncharacterized protein LY89DRAFT_589396 [Mollisia scopiformis]KUJ14981.1 hypothetical protein LY89DRAFT_589396 [Mollisia scopiformis]
MSSEVHVVAIITPAPGKETRVRELLSGLADNVKKHETDVSKYQLFEQYDGQGGNVFVVEEIYKDKSTYDAHFKTEYFQKLGEIFPKEGVLAAPLDIKTIKPVGGFATR